MSSGNKATVVFTSAVHLADKNEHPIAALHKSQLSTAGRNNAPYDGCYMVPVIGSHISYKLSISMMKRLITTAYVFLSFVIVVLGPLATANSFPVFL